MWRSNGDQQQTDEPKSGVGVREDVAVHYGNDPRLKLRESEIL